MSRIGRLPIAKFPAGVTVTIDRLTIKILLLLKDQKESYQNNN